MNASEPLYRSIPDAELEVRFTPSGGPGGQHANKSNTRVELIWDVQASKTLIESDRKILLEKLGRIVRVVVDETRSQARNRDIAQERLRARVASALHTQKKRVSTRPSKSAKARRVDSKKRRSQLKRLRRAPRLGDRS